MAEYRNIPRKYINQLAKLNKIKYTSRETSEVINDLMNAKQSEEIIYLNEQFKFSSPHLILVQVESNFPNKSNTPERFLETLVSEKYIAQSEINNEWRPSLSPHLKICAVKHEGSSVYIKLVEEKFTQRKQGYESVSTSYANFISAVVHFGSEEKIQVRCAHREKKKYISFIMNLMGFAEPYKWFTVPKLTKENAIQLCEILSAGVASTHIAIPSTVGSVRFNAKKGINLTTDEALKKIKKSIEQVGFPTNQTMDETCFFQYTDQKTSIKIEATFEVNIQESTFKFTTNVPEFVFDHVLDALIRVYTHNSKKEETTTIN